MNPQRYCGQRSLVQRIGFAVLVVTFSLAACKAPAGIIVAGTEQAHLDFANDPMFQSVGWVRGINGGSFAAGSGVLIAPDWVLTVGHVVTRDDMLGWTAMQFSFDNAFNPNRVLHPADAWYAYPGFVSDHGAGGANDIGLIHLADPITNVIPAKLYDGDVPVGTHAYLSGYGVQGYTPPSHLLPFDGEQRAGENVVDGIGDDILGIGNQFLTLDWGPVFRTPSLPLEFGGSNFDSGGGVFANMNGQVQLIALMAFVNGDFYSTGAIRPAVYLPWIHSYVTSVPEPSAALLLLTAATFLSLANARARLRRC